MARSTTRSSLGAIASALLMLIMLLWLTVSTPFVYASQQQVAQTEKAAKAAAATTDDKEDSNPLSGTTEEKSESGVNTLSEYLHELHLPAGPQAVPVKFEKCHPADLYFAFHPELHCPPPDPA